MKDQKAENLLNLALSVPEDQDLGADRKVQRRPGGSCQGAVSGDGA